MADQPVIEVSDLTKHYGKVEALCGVGLSVKAGEMYGLVGPDGAGKSTVFRVLATLLKPDSGRAAVLGLDTVKDYKAIRRRVGYMPGRFSLYRDLSVEENLNFFATVFQTTVAEHYHLIQDIYVQLEPFKHRRAGALSGGMKQKLALCCALIHQPEVLLLDEPTTGVDPVSRREFFDMLKRLCEQGITIVVSTPYVTEIQACDRIALIQAGRVLQTGTPQEVMNDHQELFRDIQHLPERAVAAGTEPAIRVQNLTKQFGSFTAVDHISFDVAQGEIFGFLGANGAGKTTAMRMLTGLSKPTAGGGTVAGYDINTQSEEIKKHIGYMSQKFSLYEDLQVWENIRLFAGIYGMKPADITRKTDELLHRLGFEAERETFVRQLPPGWKQKLAFSVAIFHEPKIVFLDEPTGGVDPVTRRGFWDLIYEAAARGITVFVTTHYMDEAEYCDRISMMVDGRIEALDTPAQLKARFRAANMDEVFQQLARHAQRQSDAP